MRKKENSGKMGWVSSNMSVRKFSELFAGFSLTFVMGVAGCRKYNAFHLLNL